MLDRALIDEAVTVRSEDTGAACRGGSTCGDFHLGSRLAAQVAHRPEYAGKIVVAVLPDTGERYLSTGVFER